MVETITFLLLTLVSILPSLQPALAGYNIVHFGARPNGRTDSAGALLKAWAKACGGRNAVSIYVPAGKFLVSKALLQGPCNNARMRIVIDGTIVAPSSYGSYGQWITFKYVQGLTILGGTFDGKGQAFWNCKTSGRSCPGGATSIAIDESKDVVISRVSSVNSELFHMVIFGSTGVTIRGVRITAPENSPNTDGIHIQRSSGITITGSTIRTGDDCISIGEGTTNVWIEKVSCGPGHGISIGSLGETPQEAGVQNITATSVVFTGTQNGLRIKTWGKPNSGFVQGVNFRHVAMNNVQNPIVIDQNYCPSDVNCPDQSSGIKISKVVYSDVHGSSATPVAMKFDCSPSNPCSGVALQNVKLTYGSQPAQSFCRHAQGSTSGFVIPPSCF